MAPTPLLDFLKRGEMARDERLLAAAGGLAVRAGEQLALLMVFTSDGDAEVRAAAEATIARLPGDRLRAVLARTDLPSGVREFYTTRGIEPAAAPDPTDDALVDDSGEIEPGAPAPTAGTLASDGEADEAAGRTRESVNQQLNRMGFTDRLRAAVKGSREMRAILVRDPNKMISASVLSSPKLTEQEIESFARMANISEDVLRIIASNRAWLKNYGVVVGLTKNPKTPLALSLNLMSRLNDRDLGMLSVDRNVPEPLRVAARKKVVASTSR